jgi:hypothetical protein
MSKHERELLSDGILGDFIETGIWRGGVCIFMRAVLEAHNCTDRFVWVADSFQGFPEVTNELTPDRELLIFFGAADALAVSMEIVQENFKRYGLLDGQLKFLPGWFKDSLPGAPIDRLAVLRLDSDLYESTIEALENLYPKLSPGGFVIVDDYSISTCRDAVRDFREKYEIKDSYSNDRLDWCLLAPNNMTSLQSLWRTGQRIAGKGVRLCVSYLWRRPVLVICCRWCQRHGPHGAPVTRCSSLRADQV